MDKLFESIDKVIYYNNYRLFYTSAGMSAEALAGIAPAFRQTVIDNQYRCGRSD
jgi:hypothetical protein